jgi:subtilisin family serine protease
MNLNRRRFLRGLAATGASLTAAGVVSGDGSAQYLAVGGSQRRFERAGFRVEQVLAGSSVFVLSGPSDALSELRGVGGVQAAERNVGVTLERPRLEQSVQAADVEETTFYDNYLWDKQVTRSVEANELATGEGSKIAVIDTGSDYRHSDLAPNLDKDAGRRFKNGSIDSGSEEDIVVGRPAPEGSDLDFDIEFVEQHVADDVEGHGTHVAGIAAASDTQGDGSRRSWSP